MVMDSDMVPHTDNILLQQHSDTFKNSYYELKNFPLPLPTFFPSLPL